MQYKLQNCVFVWWRRQISTSWSRRRPSDGQCCKNNDHWLNYSGRRVISCFLLCYIHQQTFQDVVRKLSSIIYPFSSSLTPSIYLCSKSICNHSQDHLLYCRKEMARVVYSFDGNTGGDGGSGNDDNDFMLDLRGTLSMLWMTVFIMYVVFSMSNRHRRWWWPWWWCLWWWYIRWWWWLLRPF